MSDRGCRACEGRWPAAPRRIADLGLIHWHLIPRLADDPAPREPVWSVPHATRPPTADELAASLAVIRRHLA